MSYGMLPHECITVTVTVQSSVLGRESRLAADQHTQQLLRDMYVARSNPRSVRMHLGAVCGSGTSGDAVHQTETAASTDVRSAPRVTSPVRPLVAAAALLAGAAAVVAAVVAEWKLTVWGAATPAASRGLLLLLREPIASPAPPAAAPPGWRG